MTAARRAVVEALVIGPHHTTVAEVLAAVRRHDPDAQESTVYRTLDRLVELEVVTPIETAGGATTFHLPSVAHHHLVCDRCGRVTGAAPDLLDEVAERLRSEHGFDLRADAVTLPGRCVDCAAPSPADVDRHRPH